MWPRRVLTVAAPAIVLTVAGAAAGLPLLRDRSQQRLERQAEREVTATAQLARARLLAEPAAGESTLRRAADAVDGVEVLTVRSDGPRAEATVRLVFRVRVAKTAASVFGWQRADSAACFALAVPSDAGPVALERLPCPD
ncbi:hypothetical protein ACLQ20_16165 [Micromonospora sp. DT46]|uniref:hypothetical protein n=1 Tax=unclassified Micromonospora TaxID=2617518 RepID=UPI00124B87B0|nr:MULTISPECIES: hypothetical protein [unclassified Micromonospora]KAB1158753.1 hypothetical protein F6X68_10205 [Micromonospora sp. AMSO12t]WSG01908.1 hypothetical protein OG989_30415 [Micromonospora sp. NBC_01740]